MEKKPFLYDLVKSSLIEEISNMEYGDMLPNRMVLSEKYNVARTTLERAISELVAEGYLTSRRGSGTYVACKSGNLHGHPALPMQDIPYNTDGSLWALVLSNILYDIYPHILRGVEDYANKMQKSLVICNTDNLGDKQEAYIRALLKNNVSGMVIVPAIEGSPSQQIFGQLLDANFPIVTCVRPISGFDFPGILLNSFQAGFKGTNHLLEKGCKQIAFVSQKQYASTLDRYQGYLTALRNQDIRSENSLVAFEDSFQIERTGYEITKDILLRNPQIDGIFATNDRVAMGAYYAVEESGRQIGTDVKIVGCDNTDICNRLPVKLSSIGFPAYDMGLKAGEYLYQRCMGISRKDLPIAITDVELYIRESSL